jgi:hypothetical protein
VISALGAGEVLLRETTRENIRFTLPAAVNS